MFDNQSDTKPDADVVELEELSGARDPATNRLALAQNLSPEEFAIAEKKLKRKMDLRLLACMWLIFVLNYLDRVSHPRGSIGEFPIDAIL